MGLARAAGAWAGLKHMGPEKAAKLAIPATPDIIPQNSLVSPMHKICEGRGLISLYRVMGGVRRPLKPGGPGVGFQSCSCLRAVVKGLGPAACLPHCTEQSKAPAGT